MVCFSSFVGWGGGRAPLDGRAVEGGLLVEASAEVWLDCWIRRRMLPDALGTY